MARNCGALEADPREGVLYSISFSSASWKSGKPGVDTRRSEGTARPPPSCSIAFSLVLFPFARLQLYYGLEYDANSRSVDQSTVYYSGRKWTGLGFGYLQFPIQQ